MLVKNDNYHLIVKIQLLIANIFNFFSKEKILELELLIKLKIKNK